MTRPAGPRPLSQLTSNVYTETGTRGCDPSFVTTSDGVVVIDTPHLPTHAVAMRAQAEEHGPIRYVINTEHHVDHIFGNYFFAGAGLVVHHQGVFDDFMVVHPDQIEPFDYAVDAATKDDPDGVALIPDRDEYYRDPNKGDIVFTGDLRLTIGDHEFELIHTPGHTPGQIAVHVPQERTVFTGDTIFSCCQTWLMTSDVDQWLTSLDVIAALDVDHVVPGHGPITTLDAVHQQRAVLLAWQSAVANAVARGWTREETVQRVNFAASCETDVGLDALMEHIQTSNAGSLYDKLTKGRA